jgi:hypothetical protein
MPDEYGWRVSALEERMKSVEERLRAVENLVIQVQVMVEQIKNLGADVAECTDEMKAWRRAFYAMTLGFVGIIVALVSTMVR